MVYRIRIINPNSNTSMTDSLRAPIDSLNYNDTEYTYFTAPSSSPNSINNLADAETSTTVSLPLLRSQEPSPYDANLIACFSPHPLVPALLSSSSSNPETSTPTPAVIPTIGIFEAAIHTSLHLLLASQPPGAKKQKFGIVSTGPQWRGILSDAIVAPAGTSGAALGGEAAGRWFAGVETVGLSAGELHPSEEGEHAAGSAVDGGGGEGKEGETIKEKVMRATGRLLERGDVGVVVLGCAGMVGMEEWVREEVGRRGESGVRVVDGVKAGVGVLQGVLRGGYF